MFARKIIALGSGAVMIAGAGVGALTAQAAGPAYAVTCNFQGTTTSLTPINPGLGGTPSPTGLTEEGDAAYTTGNSGSFSFAGGSLGSCTAADGTSTFTATSIASSGTYQNVSCGTGEAVSASDGVHGAVGDSAATPADATDGTNHLKINYTIDFSGGQGTLHGDATFPDGGVVDISGPVSIVPSNTGGCATSPVLGFTVRGSVHGAGNGTDVSEG